jgi:Rrf2 family protein
VSPGPQPVEEERHHRRIARLGTPPPVRKGFAISKGAWVYRARFAARLLVFGTGRNNLICRVLRNKSRPAINLDNADAECKLSSMKLSLRGEYALRALVVLGLNYSREVVRIQTISDAQNIPKRFLEQILNDLKSAGIVESRRGVAGGYRLSKAPDKISLALVIRHIEGPLAPVRCVSENYYSKCSCPDEEKCGIRSIMKEVREAIVNILEKVSVAELCERVKDLQGVKTNPLDYVI